MHDSRIAVALEKVKSENSVAVKNRGRLFELMKIFFVGKLINGDERPTKSEIAITRTSVTFLQHPVHR